MKWSWEGAVGAAIGAVLGFTVGSAKCETYTQVDPKLISYCVLFSREAVRIEVMHGTKPLAADTDVILALAKQEYTNCLAVLPTLLPLPKEHATVNRWLADMRDVMLLRSKDVGTMPATEVPPDDEEKWRAQCRAEYNSWDEDTGTVVRRGSPERVRCPCGQEVVCVQQ